MILTMTITRPEDGQEITGTMPISQDEARMLGVTTSPTPGVEIGASAQISGDDARGLIDVLVDLTHATTGISGTNPDEPAGAVPDADDLTDAQVAALNADA